MCLGALYFCSLCVVRMSNTGPEYEIGKDGSRPQWKAKVHSSGLETRSRLCNRPRVPVLRTEPKPGCAGSTCRSDRRRSRHCRMAFAYMTSSVGCLRGGLPTGETRFVAWGWLLASMSRSRIASAVAARHRVCTESGHGLPGGRKVQGGQPIRQGTCLFGGGWRSICCDGRLQFQVQIRWLERSACLRSLSHWNAIIRRWRRAGGDGLCSIIGGLP